MKKNPPSGDIGTPAYEQWQMHQLVRATRLVLAGRVMWWESDPYYVFNDLARGCEAVIEWDGVDIVRLRRNPETGTYHGSIYLGWFVGEIIPLGEILEQEFGVPYSIERASYSVPVEF